MYIQLGLDLAKKNLHTPQISKHTVNTSAQQTKTIPHENHGYKIDGSPTPAGYNSRAVLAEGKSFGNNTDSESDWDTSRAMISNITAPQSLSLLLWLP